MDTPILDRTRATFAKITHQFSLDDWADLKRKQTVLTRRLQSASNRVRRTEDAYNQAAPWGFFSSAFADNTKKAAVASLKAELDHAKGTCESAERDIAANQQALSQKCEVLLRDAQMPDHLQAICDDAELAPLALHILEQTKQRAADLWQAFPPNPPHRFTTFGS